MGKNVLFRYCRDHGLTEAVRNCLPGKIWDRASTDEKAIRDALVSIWDDFSDTKYKEVASWIKCSDSRNQMLGYCSEVCDSNTKDIVVLMVKSVKGLPDAGKSKSKK